MIALSFAPWQCARERKQEPPVIVNINNEKLAELCASRPSWEQHPVDHVFATTSLSEKQKISILGGNAARLFGLKEA